MHILGCFIVWLIVCSCFIIKDYLSNKIIGYFLFSVYQHYDTILIRIIWLSFIEILLYARLTHLILHRLIGLCEVFVLSPFNRYRNGGTESLSNKSKMTDGAKPWTQLTNCITYTLMLYNLLHIHTLEYMFKKSAAHKSSLNWKKKIRQALQCSLFSS